MEILHVTVQLTIMSQSFTFDFESVIHTLPPEFPQEVKNKILDIYSKHPEDFGGSKPKSKTDTITKSTVTKPKTLVIKIPKEFRKMIEAPKIETDIILTKTNKPENNTTSPSTLSPIPILEQASIMTQTNFTKAMDPNTEIVVTVYKETHKAPINLPKVTKKPVTITKTVTNITKEENVTYSLPSSILVLKLPPIPLITNPRPSKISKAKLNPRMKLIAKPPKVLRDEDITVEPTETPRTTKETVPTATEAVTTTTKATTTTTKAAPTTAPCPSPIPRMPPPIPLPMPIPIYPQMPVIIPMRTFYEPVIHDHPPLDKIRRIIKKDEERWERFSKKKKRRRHRHSSSSEYSSEYTDYGSRQYYDDFMHIKGH